MISSIIDKPKEGVDKDELGIEPYKNGLKAFISTAQTPLTIAIQGEWGSGKTSLMKSIQHELCSEDDDFYSIWVNTWEHSLLNDEYSTMVNIISGIIKSVVEILETDENQNVDRLKKKHLVS
ncbi:hypothetical protein GO491_05040 [Flavobacteriaceae bacterium Ap0902]|nr:hypothetical protein [Flavobacteriaceae bacterium Ap0902]